MDIPTREELNAAVEQHFRHLYPDAPLKLSRSGSHDEAYRNAWLEIRDALLDSEVNRIYWERFPDGPLKLDPENPDHNPYVNGWLEIRDAIMSSNPLPPDDDDERHDIDTSYARADLNRVLARLLPDIDPDHHQELTEYFDGAFDEIREAALYGSIPLVPEVWWVKPITVPTADGNYPHEVQALAGWRGDVLRAGVYQGADWTPYWTPPD